MDQAVYIVFSATHTGMGRFIRLVTRHPYNHVSVSLDRDIQRMYSFARYHRTIPLWGGFVQESILRYASFAGSARVKVCRVPVEQPHLTYLHNYMQRLWSDREDYLYNLPAAMAIPLHLRPSIPKTHTCASFAREILLRCRVEGAERTFPSVSSLERLLQPYVVYEGSAQPMAEHGQWGEDAFPAQTSTRYALCSTARHFGRLALRAAMGVQA